MRAARGFTLVEIVVVLLIFAILLAMGSVITRAVVAGQKRSITTTRMAAVDAALAQYLALQRRLPCPADGRKKTDTDADAGTQIVPADTSTGCTFLEQRFGVVPWRDLALAEDDATDGWGRRFTYRVFPLLSANEGADMSQCDPAGGVANLTGACTPPAGLATPCCVTCTATASCNRPLPFLQSRKGLEVQNMAGTKVMDPSQTPPTGAAYVVISHGETGGGGYLRSGQLFASTTNGNDSAREQMNYANRDPALAPIGTYTDDAVNDNVDGTHFDDIVSRPSVSAVINKAGLGPRAH